MDLLLIFHRSLRQLGFFVFFLGSVLSTAAQNMPMVLAGRGFSGVGAAFLLVVRPLNRFSYSASNVPLLFDVHLGCTRYLRGQPFYRY